MTREEIDRLEAGRDADVLVAELITLPGVRLERVPWQPDKLEPYWRHVEGGFREKFRPTSDGAAAAVVLQWLRRFQHSKQEGDAMHDEFLDHASELAICKAALRAIATELFQPEADSQVLTGRKPDSMMMRSMV